MQTQLPQFWEENIASATVQVEARRRALLGYIWVCAVLQMIIQVLEHVSVQFLQIVKALLVRNHPDINAYVNRLFAIFSDPHIGWDAAKAVGELGRGGEDILTKANFSVIRVGPNFLHFNCGSP